MTAKEKLLEKLRLCKSVDDSDLRYELKWEATTTAWYVELLSQIIGWIRELPSDLAGVSCSEMQGVSYGDPPTNALKLEIDLGGKSVCIEPSFACKTGSLAMVVASRGSETRNFLLQANGLWVVPPPAHVYKAHMREPHPLIQEIFYSVLLDLLR